MLICAPKSPTGSASSGRILFFGDENMTMKKLQNGYNDATWFDDALSQLSLIVPTDDESVDENYNSVDPGLNQEDDSCEILLESYKGDIRDILSDPSKASKLLRAALKVLGKRNKAKLSKNALLAAISVLFSACQPGNFLSNSSQLSYKMNGPTNA